MRKVLFLAIITTVCASLTFAQDKPKPEFFGGYSYEGLNSGIASSDLAGLGITQTSLDNRFNLNGFNLSGTGYLTRRFGITGDFSAAFRSRTDNFDLVSTNSSFALYDITGGPQFKFTNKTRATPFVHALFGVAHRRLREEIANNSTTVSSLVSTTDSSTDFTMNLGGGLDYRLNNRFDLRAIQVDYNPIFLRSRTVEDINFPSRTLNGLRISVGIVFK